jgi:hypothetical protein
MQARALRAAARPPTTSIPGIVLQLCTGVVPPGPALANRDLAAIVDRATARTAARYAAQRPQTPA